MPGTKSVLFVANNWDGTADIVDPQTFKSSARLNVVPDLQERLAEIALDPRKLGYFLAIRDADRRGQRPVRRRHVLLPRRALRLHLAAEPGRRRGDRDRDQARSPGASPIEGYRSDHMAISPDGKRLLVSDSTAARSTRSTPRPARRSASSRRATRRTRTTTPPTARRSSTRASGSSTRRPTSPSRTRRRATASSRSSTRRRYKVLKRYDIGQIARRGRLPRDYSLRRAADGDRARREDHLHAALVPARLRRVRPRRRTSRCGSRTCPSARRPRAPPRENYLLDSAHHGLAINPEGTKLCAAGTMSDYAAIVQRDSFAHRSSPRRREAVLVDQQRDGSYCFVSASGDDQVSAIDYASEREVARHPGRRPSRSGCAWASSGRMPSAG